MRHSVVRTAGSNAPRSASLCHVPRRIIFPAVQKRCWTWRSVCDRAFPETNFVGFPHKIPAFEAGLLRHSPERLRKRHIRSVVQTTSAQSTSCTARTYSRPAVPLQEAECIVGATISNGQRHHCCDCRPNRPRRPRRRHPRRRPWSLRALHRC